MSIFHNYSAVLGTAAAGALIAYALAAYAASRRSSHHEVRALRAEVSAERESLRAMLEALPAQIERAKRSRIATARVASHTNEEESLRWLDEVELDLSEVERLRQLSEDPPDDNSLPDMEVEVKLVEILSMSLRADALTEKYRTVSVQDGHGDRGDAGEDREDAEEGGDTRLLEAAQYSLAASASPIRESVV